MDTWAGIYVQRALGTAKVWSGVVKEQHVSGLLNIINLSVW